MVRVSVHSVFQVFYIFNVIVTYIAISCIVIRNNDKKHVYLNTNIFAWFIMYVLHILFLISLKRTIAYYILSNTYILYTPTLCGFQKRFFEPQPRRRAFGSAHIIIIIIYYSWW